MATVTPNQSRAGSMIGRRLSHFELIEEIGAGGMGVVYKARDSKLHRMVAIKTLPPAASDEPRRRFLEEARAASTLNHPGVVTIYEVDHAQGVDFIAMELVQGESLAQRLGRGRLEPERARRYAIAIAEALSVAHKAGIIHRDLKPANVMITADDRIKILDFGLAKRLPAADPMASDDLPTVADPVQTMAGTLLGTPAYMSPEQAMGRTVDARADLFSFGAVCFEMLTGKRAFRGESPVEVLSAILHKTPKLPSQEREGLPQAWDGIVSRLLEKTPRRRYPDAESVLRDLQALANRVFRWRRAVLAAGILGLFAVMLAWWTARNPTTLSTKPDAAATDTFPDFQYRLLSDFPGSHREPSLSPDGSIVAFVTEDESEIAQIWILNPDGGQPIQITFGDRGAGQPQWSQRGDRIVFERAGAGLWQVPSLGGQERQLLDHGFAPALSPDGERLAFISRGQPWIAGGDGSDARPLQGFEPRFFGFFARLTFGPEDRNLALFWPHEQRPLGELWRVPLDGGEPVQLTRLQFIMGGPPTWSQDGRWIVFASDHAGSFNLWRIDAQRGGDPIPVTLGSGSDASPTLSADGRRLVYSNGRGMAYIELFDAATGEAKTVYERRYALINPELSPDGTEVAFFARVPSGLHILILDLASGQVRQVTHGRGSLNAFPRWSADGETIYFLQQEPTLSYRRVAALGGEDELLVEGWILTVQNHPAPSPDERSVVYTLQDGGRMVESRLLDLETGEEHTLPRSLYGLRWSPDGRALWGNTPDSQDIYRCSIPPDDCTRITTGREVRLSPDGSSLFFLRAPSSSQPDIPLGRRPGPVVWKRDLATGAEQEIHRLLDFNAVDFGYGVTLEGQLVLHRETRGRAELWLGEAVGRREQVGRDRR